MAKAATSAKQTPKLTSQKLSVKVFSPYQIYYQGEATSVSASNKTGPFDVLPGHANFFTLLIACDVVVETGYDSLNFPVSRGIVKVYENTVTVFADV